MIGDHGQPTSVPARAATVCRGARRPGRDPSAPASTSQADDIFGDSPAPAFMGAVMLVVTLMTPNPLSGVSSGFMVIGSLVALNNYFSQRRKNRQKNGNRDSQYRALLNSSRAQLDEARTPSGVCPTRSTPIRPNASDAQRASTSTSGSAPSSTPTLCAAAGHRLTSLCDHDQGPEAGQRVGARPFTQAGKSNLPLGMWWMVSAKARKIWTTITPTNLSRAPAQPGDAGLASGRARRYRRQ